MDYSEKLKSKNDLYPAGFWIRFIAHLIDTAILIFPIYIIKLMLLGVIRMNYFVLENILYLVLGCVYYTILTGKTGQTWGKKVFNIKVIDKNGNNINYGKAFFRWCAYLPSYLILFFGYFMVGWNKEKRALHDYIVGTKVIFLNKSTESKTKISKKKKVVIILLTILVILGVIIAVFGLKSIANRTKNLNIIVENIKTGKTRNLTEEGRNTNPIFSNNGEKIFYSYNDETDNEKGNIIRQYSLKTNKITDVINDGNFNLLYSLGRDDNEILISLEKEGKSDLWLYSLSTESRYRVTDDELEERDASLSPDGKWVLFTQKVDSFNEVFIIPSKGGKKIRITNTNNFLYMPKSPTWSRNSREVAYFRFLSIVIYDIYNKTEQKYDITGINNYNYIIFHPIQKDIILFKGRGGGLGFNLYLLSREESKLQIWKTKRSFYEFFYDISQDGSTLVYSK